MRWERTHRLPVHRLPGGPKARVYALKSELDGWRASGKQTTSAEVVEAITQPSPAHVDGAVARRIRLGRIVLGVLVLLTVIAILWAWRVRPGEPRAITIARLTYERSAMWPSISADGRIFAFVSDRAGTSDIYVQQVAGSQAVRLTRSRGDNWQPCISPDGVHVAFRSDRDGGGLYVMETIGGQERKLADRGGYPAFSPDGATILFLVRNAFSGRAGMFLVAATGAAPRPFQPAFDVPAIGTTFSTPMWSADGSEILFEGVRRSDGARGLWVAPAAGGEALTVGGMPPMPRGKIRIYTAWTGRHVYYVEGTSVQGAPLNRAPTQPRPWRISGRAEQLTAGSSVCGRASVSLDGRVVVLIAGSFVNSIWSLPVQPETGITSGQARQETPDAYNQMLMSVARDGSRFAYIGYGEDGRLEIRVVDASSRRVTSVPLSAGLRAPLVRLNADGTRLAFNDVLADKAVSYVVPAFDPARGKPTCEDCSIVGFFRRSDDLLVSEAGRLVRQQADGRARTMLIDGPAADPALSPDDKWIAFVAPKPDGSAAVFVAPVHDRPVPRQEWVQVAEDANSIGSPQWSPGGSLLYYLSNRDSSACVWARGIDAGRVRPGGPVHVYHDPGHPSIKATPARSLAVTSDRLYLMMATTESNIWTLKLAER
jgi:Tol biopolymer transport system component